MQVTHFAVLLLALTCVNAMIVEKVEDLPAKIIAGEIHYSRIPVEYWEHRLLTIKSMGFNALSIYIMWNYHETGKGKFDYETENKNLPLFLSLAKKHNFYVLFRPGPYVCAEWDFGGLPPRLLNPSAGVKIRQNDPAFLAETKIYFQSLVPIILPNLATNGGPIVLLQIQNQYGFYGNDKNYIQALRQLWWDLGVKTDEYYVDTIVNIEKCHWNGANIGINDGITQQQYDFARMIEPKGMLLGGQIYSGWLTHWGEEYQGKSLQRYTRQFEFLLSKNHSFSMYMVHGGTNFGLTAGANSKSAHDSYTADITTYDYEAPINEQGSPNEKFTAFRNLALKYLNWPIPEPPTPLPMIEIPAFKPYKVADLLGNLPSPAITNSSQVFFFESDKLQMYEQGFAVYETQLTAKTYKFSMVAHDFAIVYLDDKFVGSFDRSKQSQWHFEAKCESKCKMYIVVEAMGHINFDHSMEVDWKGLISINQSSTKLYWNIYKVPIDSKIAEWRKLSDKTFPALSKATFNVSTPADTYLNVKGYKKGYLWVNGRNLGRYWNIGPSYKLFVPGVWLKKGQNLLYILDLLTDENSNITGEKTLK